MMASVMGLHLQYRLWIAEMNADINMLRIFDDYLAEITTNNNSNEVIKHIENYREQFINLRNQMDELRHEMHLNKMKLAEIAKEPYPSKQDIKITNNYEVLKERYEIFKNDFDKTKNEFQKFCNKAIT